MRAVLISTPTAYGAVANVAELAACCHRRGVPLLVDEAWGAHFGFHPGLPTAAVQAGADLVVQSLPPAEVILFGTDLIDPAALRSRLVQIGTAGPSAVPVPMADALYYLCGPMPFLQSVRSALIDRGVVPADIQYEVFGPDLWQADRE